MNNLRFGVIGVGTFGETHLKAYRDHPSAEIAAVCDLDEQRLHAVGERYGVRERFADYHDLLAIEGLDAVSVATPDFAHTDIVVDAVGAGKAVLVEKPLATTMADCDRIGEALRARPVPFMVDFHNRWNPGVSEIKKAVRAGDLGRVEMSYHLLSDTIFVPAEMLSWAGRSSILWFLCSHCLDTLRWILGDEVARVYSVSGSRVLGDRGIDTPDYYLTTVEFAGGAKAVIENCWILPESSPCVVDFKLEVVGEKETFHFDPTPERLLRLGADGARTLDSYAGVDVHGRTRGFTVDSIRHFVDCLLQEEEPLVGYEDGRRVTEAVLAIERSAREGRPVDL